MKTNWHKKYILANIADKEPWQVTRKEYLDYHYTGGISSSAYDDYKTVEGLNWLEKDKHTLLYDTKTFGNKTIEFRKKDEDLKYVKTDENNDIVRDEQGNVLYLSQDEMIKQGRPLKDTSIVAFDGDTAIGWASNEFGADGVWVVDDYQKLGIGTYLLMEFRKQFPTKRKVGQMTQEGYNMTGSLHKKYVEQALQEGKPVPQNVLNDYPELLENIEPQEVEPRNTL